MLARYWSMRISLGFIGVFSVLWDVSLVMHVFRTNM